MQKIALMAAVLLVLAACEDKDPAQPKNDPTLTLSADSVGVVIGATTTVTATITNSTAAAQFLSRNDAIAEVTSTGVITGIGAGRTFVVSTLAGTAVRDSVIVGVRVPTNPGQPVQLPLLGTGIVTERHTAEIAVAEPFAYTATTGFRTTFGNAIKIWNVTGNTPMLIDSLIVSGVSNISDIQISSDGALLVASLENGTAAANHGIVIYDRANGAKPTLIKRYTSATAGQGVHTVKLGRINNRHYAFLSVNPSGGQKAKLAIVDITNPAVPVEVAVREMGDPFVHDVFIRDGILFAALWHTGLRIFDVGGGNLGGSPANPIMIGTVKTAACSTCPVGTSSVHNVWWFHDPTTNGKRYAFVGEEYPSNLGGQQRMSGSVHVVDVINMSAPVEVAVYEPDSTTTWSGKDAGAHNFVMDEQSGVLYAAFYNGGVRALDVRGDLSVCTAAQKTANGRCNLRLMGREIGVALSNPGVLRFVWGVALQGNNLYASDMPNGIHKINIAALKR
jgi:hypothetical protein